MLALLLHDVMGGTRVVKVCSWFSVEKGCVCLHSANRAPAGATAWLVA